MRCRICVTACAVTMSIATLVAQGASSSAASAAISGHVTDSASAPVSDYSVVVFPTDRTKWLAPSPALRVARPAQDGSFEVTSLAPGEYWVAAVKDTAAADSVDDIGASGDGLKPETLERLSFRATRVTLTERQRVMTVLRLIRR